MKREATNSAALKNHELVENYTPSPQVIYEKRPLMSPDGEVMEGLYNAWIILNNPAQYNSYTTQMVKDVIMCFHKASMDRSVVAIVFTAVGDKAFCTGGNTKEYAEYYSGNPQEYSQYMRLFNDMVSAILKAEKPVINRVNGMRIAGGQEIGMACDFTIAADTAVFGQAGPRHGSAPIGGATDFLPLFIGIERAMYYLTTCERLTAYQAYLYGLISDVVPCLKLNGQFIRNPLVVTNRFIDENGKIIYGTFKTGKEYEEAKELMRKCEVDLSLLDKAVDKLIWKLANTFPNCTMKTISEVRKFKLEHWDRNKESSKEWLALNMMT